MVNGIPEKVPVIVLRNKNNHERYLASSMDAGDWEDANLDVTLEDIKNAFMIWRHDFSKPEQKDVENARMFSEQHKKRMKELFGEKAFIVFDLEEILKAYEPINIEVSRDDFEHMIIINE